MMGKIPRAVSSIFVWNCRSLSTAETGAVAVFTDRGIKDLQTEIEACVDLLADLKIRAEFIKKLRMFYETLNILEHRPELQGDVFRDAKLLGFINKVASNLYRDPALNLLGIAERVKADWRERKDELSHKKSEMLWRTDGDDTKQSIRE